jgi:SepF-like predicted cell division protein (DUF552 family)
MPINELKERFSRLLSNDQEDVELGEEYVELEADFSSSRAKVLVKPFTIKDFEDIKPVLDAVREGRTIGLVNIAPIKDKDVGELKRSVDKIKKVIDANEGDIAGFGENWLIVTPSFAKVWRAPPPCPDDVRV